jgi:hypothetical protein
MRIEWFVVRIQYRTWKLWGSEAAGGFYPQWLRQNVYLVPTLGRETKGFFMVGGGPPPKVLEAYMGEVVWPHPPGSERQGLHGHWPNVKA